jgi:xanthine dehydrogenase accessory factor
MEEVFSGALEALRAGEPVCVATIVAASGSTPRDVGTKMLIRPDGGTVGTIGGGPMEQTATQDALAALELGRSTVKHYSLLGHGEDSLSICGGEADVFLEVLNPEPELVLVGGGHVGLSLAELGVYLGFRVTVIDDRPEFATAERFPMAHRTIVAPSDQVAQVIDITGSTSILIATHGHSGDAEALRAVISSPAAYIGMVGSQRKVASIWKALGEQGVSKDALARIYSPVGLDIGSESPAEIALSIMAELLLVLRGGTGRPLAKAGNPHRKGAHVDG